MFSTFTAIFEALAAIEDELSADTTSSRRDQLVDTLLSLRNTMDKCIQLWFKFEERINEIQERYSIALPDILPPGFGKEFNEQEAESAELESIVNMYMDMPADLEAREVTAEYPRPSNQIVINSFRKGLGFWELTMLKEAVAEFNKVVEEEPNLTLGHLCLGLSSAQLGKAEEAFRELKLVLALDQNKSVQALVFNTLGIILTEKEHYRQARHFFEKATEAAPDMSEAWFNLAAISYNMQEYQKAEEAFEKVKKLAPDDWEIELHLGRSRVYQGDYKKAAEALQRAYGLNPREPIITFELGLIYRILEKKVCARRFFLATLKLLEAKR
jgi:tetratricopeptide (TPR) repeat protein